jgi:hypothetical protein
MRIIVPYANLESATRLAILGDGYKPELLELDANEGYWKLLLGLWLARKSFIIIEQDVVVFPGAIKDMADCKHSWCARPYMLNGKLRPALGCTKFTKEIIYKFPDLLEHIPEGKRHWSGLDTRLIKLLEDKGFKCHIHRPAVTHLNILQQPEKSRMRYGV